MPGLLCTEIGTVVPLLSFSSEFFFKKASGLERDNLSTEAAFEYCLMLTTVSAGKNKACYSYFTYPTNRL